MDKDIVVLACSLILLITVIGLGGANSPAATAALNSTALLQPTTSINWLQIMAEVISISAIVVSAIFALDRRISKWLKDRRYNQDWGYSL